MAVFVYQCDVNTAHPVKRFSPSEPVAPPCCCGKPMVKVPAVPQGKYQNMGQGTAKPGYVQLSAWMRRSEPSYQQDQSKAYSQIQKRAYEICIGRKNGPGTELTDWLQAEKEIKGKHYL